MVKHGRTTEVEGANQVMTACYVGFDGHASIRAELVAGKARAPLLWCQLWPFVQPCPGLSGRWQSRPPWNPGSRGSYVLNGDAN